MLDFVKLIQQFPAITPELQKRDQQFTIQRARAQETFEAHSYGWQSLREKYLRDRKTITWLTALPTEPLLTIYPLPTIPSRYTVCASDGSEIAQERHRALHCYVINISKICLSYGSEQEPILESEPEIFYREDDLVLGKGVHREPVDHAWISCKRDMRELQVLKDLMKKNQSKTDKTNNGEQKIPVLGLLDGTLIRWNLENKDPELRKHYLHEYVAHLSTLHRERLPFASYISQPGSSEVVNLLRVALCPYDPINCDQCPDIPCDLVKMVVDRTLMDTVLQPGERSAVFESRSKILEQYGDERIHFFYIHMGSEIGRVEIPKWIAEDKGLLDLVHAVIYDQAKKGQGYPISLVEAHEQAVITTKDREQFFELLEGELVSGKREVKISGKAMSKKLKIV